MTLSDPRPAPLRKRAVTPVTTSPRQPTGSVGQHEPPTHIAAHSDRGSRDDSGPHAGLRRDEGFRRRAPFPVAVDSLSGARDILRELESETADPLVYLIRGRSGTGKSTLLGAIRHRLRGHGIAACDTLTEALDCEAGPRPALILDDAHTLSRVELEGLCAAAGSGCCTMVIATRPGPHDPALRALVEAVSAARPVIDLRALGVTDIAPFARELGMTVPRAVAQHVHRQTGGIHGGVVAALSAACATRLDAGVGAVDEAVAAWARSMLDNTDPDLLEVFVVATTGAGLDPGELTEVLGIDQGTARDLIDRARATALVTDADLLLEFGRGAAAHRWWVTAATSRSSTGCCRRA